MEIKSILCDGREEVNVFLNNMYELGYNVKKSVISITQDRGFYTVFYVYYKNLGEPSY